MKKIKLFALALTAMFSLNAMAGVVTFSASEIAAGTEKSGITPYFGSALKSQANVCKDGGTQIKADVCEVKNTADTTLVNNLIAQAQVIFTASGKYITKVVVKGSTNSTGSGGIKNVAAIYWTGTTLKDEFEGAELVAFSGYDAACEDAYYSFENMPAQTQMVALFRRLKVDDADNPTKKMNKSGANYGSGGTFYVAEAEVTYADACEAPGTPLALVITPSANLTAGDIVTISTEGGNGNPVSFTLDGNTYSDGPTWTAVAGTHAFAVSQDENAGVCGGDDEVILNVASTSPVTSATVAGPNVGFIGQELTYTVTAENATTYAWYVDGVAQAETSATFVYTAAAGDHTIYATATNAYTSDPVQSNTIALTVTKLCGMLINAEHDGTAKGATVTGVIGGTVDKNTQAGGKLGSNGHFFGIKLASGDFQVGDVVTIYASTISAFVQIFSDKGNTMLNEGTFDDAGIYTYTLMAATEWIYLYRTEAGGSSMNPTLGYIQVDRPCAASDNADLGKVWCQIGEEAIYFEPEADGLTYNIVVPASIPLTEADLQFSLAHPLATPDVASPIHFTIPAAGAPAETATIVVTAEDGTTQKTYTINVSKSAEADHDATLSSLAVTGYTLVPAFDPAVIDYTITKAYGSANPGTDKIVLERASSVSSSTKEAVGDDLVITVTAEDGTTQLVYTIHIAEAAADKDLLEVAFSNGAKGDIDAANFIINVPYLTGEAAPTYVSAQFASWVEGASAEMVGNDLQVTGADGQTALYTINAVEMFPAPVVVNSDVVFDGSEVYIHAHYGWDSAKGWKMAKYTEEKGNRRISSGNNRMYIALPAAKSVFLTSGTGGAREATITVNGVVSSITKLAGENAAIQLGLSDTHANLIEVINKGNGDGGFISMQLSDQPTQLGEAKAEDAVKAHKEIRNGQIIIVRGDKEFDLTGAPLN